MLWVIQSTEFTIITLIGHATVTNYLVIFQFATISLMLTCVNTRWHKTMSFIIIHNALLVLCTAPTLLFTYIARKRGRTFAAWWIRYLACSAILTGWITCHFALICTIEILILIPIIHILIICCLLTIGNIVYKNRLTHSADNKYRKLKIAIMIKHLNLQSRLFFFRL